MRNDKLAAEIAARLRAERARLNLTLREVGERSGVHYVTVGRYEQGKPPTLAALYRLAACYGVEATSLLPPVASVSDLSKGRRKT